MMLAVVVDVGEKAEQMTFTTFAQFVEFIKTSEKQPMFIMTPDSEYAQTYLQDAEIPQDCDLVVELGVEW